MSECGLFWVGGGGCGFFLRFWVFLGGGGGARGIILGGFKGMGHYFKWVEHYFKWMRVSQKKS